MFAEYMKIEKTLLIGFFFFTFQLGFIGESFFLVTIFVEGSSHSY